jgi:hypothetical protein
MSALLALALLGVLALAGVLGLARLAAAPREWSEEEYDRRRRRRSSGLLATSMKVLGEEIDPGGKRAAEARAALEQGAGEDEQRSGEP